MSGRKTQPRLSIGLPVYNGERFLPESLSCLLGQTFGDFELVVCDNASTDGTEQICRDYAAHDARLRYHRNQRNLGANANFNLTFVLSRAPLFKWAAHDDLHAASYLARCIAILDRNPDVVLAHSASAFIGDDGREFAWDAGLGGYVDPWTGMCRRPDRSGVGDRARAPERFWQVLFGALWGSHIFGVIRRPALDQTRLLANFVSSDRALLAELALLGRFRSSGERLFKKRFHQNVSWALDQAELREYISTSDTDYSRRWRQLEAFFSATRNKPIGSAERMACTGMVALRCIKVFADALSRRDSRNAAKARLWRERNEMSAIELGRGGTERMKV
jgi:glycosyltransferase involved in cell wall biosynthesis